ncbi:MAG: SH3 domain-containing protein [Schwartzia sp.]|nr:SH3 domain-containing protein [Schwartzia sp. (in: firmicutes)]
MRKSLYSVKKAITIALLAGTMSFPASGIMPWNGTVAAAAQTSVSATAAGDPLLVNKTHKLPDNYESEVSLVTVKNCFGKKFRVERETYRHFRELREDLLKSGIQLELESAYRSVARQRELTEELRASEGEDYVKNYVAVPGYSEHHTGLALDVTIVKDGKTTSDYYGTEETPYQVMHRRLADHGFILRYPPGKAGVTGYEYESWHIRYVGQETARKIFRQGLTLEEYLAGGDETRAAKGKYGAAEYWTRRNPGGDAVISEDALAELRATMRQNPLHVDMAAYPDEWPRDAVRRKMAYAKSCFWYFEPEEVFENGAPLARSRYWQVVDNCAINALPERQAVRFALTTARANLRYLPASTGWYESANDTHYDLLQGVTVNPAEPLAVLAESRDKRFCFVEMRNFTGWVERDAIAFTTRDKWMEYAAPEHFLVITGDRKDIRVDDALSLPFSMGARLPLRKPEPQADGTWLVSVPREVNQSFHEAAVRIPADDTVHKGWLPYSENNLIRQAFRFLGDLYGWGGLEGGVDCSLFTADVYRSVGIDLWADAGEQQKDMTRLIPLEAMDDKGKLAAIAGLRPGDLLFTEGHVMMYLGRDDSGNPFVIQAESSRWFPGEGEEDKALKYYTRRVKVDDLFFYKSSEKKCLERLISAGGLR